MACLSGTWGRVRDCSWLVLGSACAATLDNKDRKRLLETFDNAAVALQGISWVCKGLGLGIRDGAGVTMLLDLDLQHLLAALITAAGIRQGLMGLTGVVSPQF